MANRFFVAGLALATSLAVSLPSFAQQGGVSTQTVVTVMPKDGKGTTNVNRDNIQVTTNRKPGTITDWVPLRGDRSGLELVILIDDSLRSGIGNQLSSLKSFINQLPQGTEVGIAYMQNGEARFLQNLTPDHQVAAQGLRLPQGVPGGNASPYFCLSDLAKHWPSSNPDTRREVLMVTDGVDRYSGRRFDPEDPYVQAAMEDSQKAGLIVYSIYYRDAGRLDRGFAAFGGQNYLDMVAHATGGKAYFIGNDNPVSFDPFLDELHTRLMNQYELGFLAQPGHKPQLQALKVKSDLPRTEVSAPENVLVGGQERGSLR